MIDTSDWYFVDLLNTFKLILIHLNLLLQIFLLNIIIDIENIHTIKSHHKVDQII